jgi:hypothetical protein
MEIRRWIGMGGFVMAFMNILLLFGVSGRFLELVFFGLWI